MGSIHVRPDPKGRNIALFYTPVQDRKPPATLQSLGRLAIGPRKPWELRLPDFPQSFDSSSLAMLRLARERQNAGLNGRGQHARSLLWSEINCLRVKSRPRAPSFDVEELLTRTAVPTGVVCVRGVARPLSGSSCGVGDPGSEASVEVVGLKTPVSRGSPMEVAGRWDAQHERLNDAVLVTCGLLSDNVAWQGFADGPAEEPRARHLPSISPEGWLQDFVHTRTWTAGRRGEAALLPQAVDVLETAFCDLRLSLGTLCRVHELVANAPAGVGGRLRNGPAVVRLNGLTTFAPPPAAFARGAAEAFVIVLAEHLLTGSDEVPPPLLAAESVARFTDLHPFPDGNGRVARAIATWLLVRAGYRPRPNLTLGGFCHFYQHECYRALRHHELDPWTWHQFFFDAVLTCFDPSRHQ